MNVQMDGNGGRRSDGHDAMIDGTHK